MLYSRYLKFANCAYVKLYILELNGVEEKFLGDSTALCVSAYKVKAKGLLYNVVSREEH